MTQSVETQDGPLWKWLDEEVGRLEDLADRNNLTEYGEAQLQILALAKRTVPATQQTPTHGLVETGEITIALTRRQAEQWLKHRHSGIEFAINDKIRAALSQASPAESGEDECCTCPEHSSSETCPHHGYRREGEPRLDV
jgi:hypothetical protein